MNKLTLTLICASASLSLNAQTNSTPAEATPPVRLERSDKEKQDDNLLRGLGFGVGVGAIFDVGGSPRVKNATVDANNIVRVEKEDSVHVGALLETHYLYGIDNHLGFTESQKRKARVAFIGPQISLQLGSDNIIEGVGVGCLLALQRVNPDSVNFGLKSFNLGVGGIIQPNAQKLGDGIQVNRPLPAGDHIRYKTEPEAGIYIVFSVGF